MEQLLALRWLQYTSLARLATKAKRLYHARPWLNRDPSLRGQRGQLGTPR